MYTPIYLKTNYSFLESTIRIEKLIDFAVTKNFKYVCITDINMIGVMEFYHLAKQNNLIPVVGLEISLNSLKLLAFGNYYSLISLATLSSEKELEISDLDNSLTYVLPYDSKDLLDILKLDNIYLGYKNEKEEIELSLLSENIIFLPKHTSLTEKEAQNFKYLSQLKGEKIDKEEINNYYLDNYDKKEETENFLSNFVLDIKKEEDVLPIYDINIDAKKSLIELSIKGLCLRLNKDYKDIDVKYKERLKKELTVINSMNFANYFLVVSDFIRYAKKNKILVSPGRGSVVGSLVAYTTGITDIDPLKYNLYFERFLNASRITMPDIDTDFPDIYREDVIEYVKDKYGKENVSGVVTVSTMQTKQLVREISKLFNIDNKIVERILKLVDSKTPLKEAVDKSLTLKEIFNSSLELRKIYDLCIFFDSFPHHTSIHASAIIISNKNLKNIIPLIKSNDLYLTSYTMNYLEELGLLKMDFLGIKNLTTIMNIMEDIKVNENIEIDFNKIDLDDKLTLNLFKNANTKGIFQFDSYGMRRFLSNLKVDSFSDIYAAIALYRPGPQENIPSYIRRKEGKEKIEYLDKSLENILSSTYGILIYQEQIMEIAHIYAGFTLKEADSFRKAVSKKNLNDLKNLEESFISSSMKLNRDPLVTKKIFDLILKFANYGFNKSHSVAYSVVAFKQAYFKAHYKEYFYKEILLNEINDKEKTEDYIKEAKVLGIDIKGPSILKSATNYSLEKNTLYYPLIGVKGIGLVLAEKINSINKSTDIYDMFTSLYEIGVRESTFETLIKVGAFDSYKINRKSLIEALTSLINYAELKANYFSEDIRPVIVSYKDYTEIEKLEMEKELLGFYLSSYPTSLYKKEGFIEVKDIDNYINKDVTIVLYINKIKEIITKNGEKMAFVDASDKDKVSLTIFPNTYKDIEINKKDIVEVNGQVVIRNSERQIIVKTIKKLTSL